MSVHDPKATLRLLQDAARHAQTICAGKTLDELLPDWQATAALLAVDYQRRQGCCRRDVCPAYIGKKTILSPPAAAAGARGTNAAADASKKTESEFSKGFGSVNQRKLPRTMWRTDRFFYGLTPSTLQ
jgi:hypothetical protein